MRAVKKQKLTLDDVCLILGEDAKLDFEAILSNKKVGDSHKKYSLLYSKLGNYYSKCCYCESQLTGPEVEHYRPKSEDEYWWLVYSWDNLMPICSTCNRRKSNKFPVLGQKITTPSTTIKSLSKAQNLIKAYNKKEKPVLINPECDDIPDTAFIFEKNGAIKSANKGDRFDKTIEIIKLDRQELRNARKRILDEFEKHIKSILLNKAIIDKREAIIICVNLFKEDANDDFETYTAFRKYAAKYLLFF